MSNEVIPSSPLELDMDEEGLADYEWLRDQLEAEKEDEKFWRQVAQDWLQDYLESEADVENAWRHIYQEWVQDQIDDLVDKLNETYQQARVIHLGSPNGEERCHEWHK